MKKKKKILMMKKRWMNKKMMRKLLNLENPSPIENEIASLMDTTACHATTAPEITSVFTTTIPPPPHFFNLLPQQATLTPTPTISEATTTVLVLLDLATVFRFNDRVTNLERDLSELKQVNQYAQAISSIPSIMDRYMDNKLVRTVIREEVKTQLPKILPKAVLAFATPVIERNVTKSLEAVVLARSSSQPKSTYEAAASLSEYELIKILLDKMEESKSHLRDDYKKDLYDALVKSYKTNKDLFNTYDRGTKRSKLSKEVESSRDSRSKEKKSSSTSKDASYSQHKPSGKSAHAEEPSHTVDDSRVPQDQEFDTGNNDEQPADKEVSKADCQVAQANEPRTSFDELIDTSFDFSAFVLNQLNIKDLTQEILATTERHDWHNPEGKLYPFDLSKPHPLIQDHRGRQVIPQDFFINKDLEYLKGGDLSRRYSTSVMKTKVVTYEIKWIEDLVQNLWSLVIMINDKHAYWGTSYWGTSYWGPKREHFYRFAANMSSSKDVYSRKRIIAVPMTSPTRHRRHVTSTCSTEADQSHNRRTDIDKQLYKRRLMRNLEKFIGGREYGNDLRLLEWTI
ncbi:hypothetical protein Tco_0491411 [Tanacetum coccineum]